MSSQRTEERGVFIQEWCADRWYPWRYHSIDLVKRILEWGLRRGRVYRLQARPGGPCVEYRPKDLEGVELENRGVW